ncbi:amylo-alpha-1,6-glucosidase [Roseburia inulinivorans]|jgi:predicted glycogen debranching enzyme|uniref:4-alpha-glucanotransferase n=1 Tax=Roseburia inulinivorans TaxID=360807 RepID=A0A3R6GVN7_9FIRM|nr:amylo-alpha-1,6-glucosidase [Roseburia inulinivorans]MBD9192116.1 4-alpha-glucanotransferase [Roseburia inulinivorans]RHA83422.1 4-alpha-glucanotransferase [Roseburia inulinivorans]
MITYQYTQKDWTTFKEGIKREWAVTNGIGGYAGSSMIGAHSRTHQGYLIASLHAPIERYLVFSKINETATVGTSTVSFETSQHCASGKTVYTEGQKFLTSFIYDGSVHYTYETDNFSFEKHITLKRNANVCAVAYELTAGDSDCTFTLTPLFNYREHSESSTPDTLKFETFTKDRTFYLVPEKNKDIAIRFQTSEGTFSERETVYDIDMQLQIEVDLETDGLDCHYCPVDLSIAVPANTTKKVSILCSIGDVNERPAPVSATEAFSILEENARCHAELFEKAGYRDSFANQLVLASDQFLTYRESTKMMTVLAGLPWFTDWGRDTMIAFTGLTLCTKRFKEAEEILLTFARYIRHGIVPNMFPDDNMPPLYNTVDASLWYFYAVYQYLHYNPAAEAEAFVKEQIFPHLKEIISAYEKGTDFSIYMEDDGLIHAGSGLDQITWMDVRVGDWVATPRHGKPVEINALWYNALRIMESLCEKFDEDASAYRTRANQVKESFNAKFWDSSNQCLFDVVDGDEPDDHIRPNQIYAVSLPFSLLPEEQEKAVVALVEKVLFVGCGLRSLAPDHPDYHGIYCGALAKRDAAYHQGTAWGFLLGGFFSAYMKVNHHSSSAAENAVHMLEPVRKHLSDSGCIGSISEIFDGDTPHNPRGCYAQAWSVGEVLRCYCEDILPYL